MTLPQDGLVAEQLETFRRWYNQSQEELRGVTQALSEVLSELSAARVAIRTVLEDEETRDVGDRERFIRETLTTALTPEDTHE